VVMGSNPGELLGAQDRQPYGWQWQKV